MSVFSKLVLYGRAAGVQRNLNVQGLPLVPKWLSRTSAYDRKGFNQFILWIHTLQLPKVDRVIDVGANHGDFSLAASALYPEAHVLLVEPLPTLHADLQRRCARHRGRWQLVPCALGGDPGTATLHIDPRFDAIGSLVGFSADYLKFNPEARPGQTVQCTVRTLDELCVAHAIESIDLLKIDVEGFEFETIRGGKQMLSKTRAIIVEVSLVRRTAKTHPLPEMLDLLIGAGFHIVQIYPSPASSESPWLPMEYNLLARRS